MLDKIFPTMRPNEITQKENTDTEKRELKSTLRNGEIQASKGDWEAIHRHSKS